MLSARQARKHETTRDSRMINDTPRSTQSEPASTLELRNVEPLLRLIQFLHSGCNCTRLCNGRWTTHQSAASFFSCGERQSTCTGTSLSAQTPILCINQCILNMRFADKEQWNDIVLMKAVTMLWSAATLIMYLTKEPRYHEHVES